MADCAHCGYPIANHEHKYCECCFEMVCAAVMAPILCFNCKCPIDDERKEVYELENERGELREFCAVCFEMVGAVCKSPYFVALEWAAEEAKKKAEKHCDDD